MNHKVRTKRGITLTEMTVVIAVVALLGSLGLPAVRMLFDSFESQSGGRSVISAALASARAIAAREQRYAGVRFQKAYQPEDSLRAPQYMIFVVQDPDMMAYGFRAVEGVEPIKLPGSVGVMDLTIVTKRNVVNPVNPQQARLDDPLITPDQKDQLINDALELTDTTTFSIIFSPSGKLVIHGIRVRNRDGRTERTQTSTISSDDIFNTQSKVADPVKPFGMFVQDDYAELGLGPEPSRNMFIIYEEEKFRQAYENGRAWSDYLVKLVSETIYINPYTGTIIER